MGWGHGVNYKGEEVGYLVPDVCHEDGCDEAIDRGLAYACGGLEGVLGEGPGCGGYFCGEHLWLPEEDVPGFYCLSCLSVLDGDDE